jgi:DNA-binding response OmpR family regulator
MQMRLLVADDNLDVQELVNDILLINFKDVVVDRVLDADTLRAKLGTARQRYDLVIAASSLLDGTGKSAGAIVRDEFPDHLDKMILLEDTAGQEPSGPDRAPGAVLTKPFSLDEFGDCIRRICPR